MSGYTILSAISLTIAAFYWWQIITFRDHLGGLGSAAVFGLMCTGVLLVTGVLCGVVGWRRKGSGGQKWDWFKLTAAVVSILFGSLMGFALMAASG